MADLDVKVGILENENEQLKIENEALTKNVENLENKVIGLETDVLELEKIVRPGKIPASCQEYFDRGTSETGQYEIKPNTEIEPFFVHCDFRNLFLKKSAVFSPQDLF